MKLQKKHRQKREDVWGQATAGGLNQGRLYQYLHEMLLYQKEKEIQEKKTEDLD